MNNIEKSSSKSNLDFLEKQSIPFLKNQQSLEFDENLDTVIQTIEQTDNVNPDNNFAIGIDLGTKNCCVAVYINKDIYMIPNSFNKKSTPSYISFEDNDKITIGEVAKSEAYKNPRHTIYDSKRMLGRTMTDDHLKDATQNWEFEIVQSKDNKPLIKARSNLYQPEEISAKLIQECVNMAERFLNRKVTSAVITVPAYFDDRQKKATIKAGEYAGLNVLKLLNEPTAAAIAYRIKRIYKDSKLVLIFDLGGGTFDVAIADLQNNKINVLGIDGNAFLGGEDFDTEVVKYCVETFNKQHNVNILDEAVNAHASRTLALIRAECEKKKIYLDVKESITINVPSVLFIDKEVKDMEVELTRKKYDEMTEHLIDQMLDIVDSAIQSCGIEKDEIDDIILVGASTRAPTLQQRLRNFFGGTPLNSSINPDDAVAYGAAVYAAYLNNNEEVKEAFEIEKIQDVVPMSIGVSAIIGGKKDQFDKIINKNTPYPYEKSYRYTTHYDNQTQATISVYQGEKSIASKNTILGEFKLSGIPKNKAKKECIVVSMQLDHNGILRVTATSESTNGSETLVVDNLLNLWG